MEVFREFELGRVGDLFRVSGAFREGRRDHGRLDEVAESSDGRVDVFRVDDFFVFVERDAFLFTFPVTLFGIVRYPQHGYSSVVGRVELRKILKNRKVKRRFRDRNRGRTSNSISVSGNPSSPPSTSSPVFSNSSMIGRDPACGRSRIM